MDKHRHRRDPGTEDEKRCRTSEAPRQRPQKVHAEEHTTAAIIGHVHERARRVRRLGCRVPEPRSVIRGAGSEGCRVGRLGSSADPGSRIPDRDKRFIQDTSRARPNRNGKATSTFMIRSRRRSASRLSARAFNRSSSEIMPTSRLPESRSTIGNRVSPVSAMR